MEDNNHYIENAPFNLKQFFKEALCKKHNYKEIKAWIEYTKGGKRETIMGYYLINTCSRCGKKKFIFLDKIFEIYSSEAKKELEKIIEKNSGEINEVEIKGIIEKFRKTTNFEINREKLYERLEAWF